MSRKLTYGDREKEDLANERVVRALPRWQSRIVGGYYLLTVAMGIVILFAGSRRHYLVDVIAAAFYVAVTAVFYALTKGRTDILSKER